jgi:hypothetical protein
MSPQTITAVRAVDQRRTERDLAEVTRWLREYVSQPHAKLGRRGPVCPFVPAALDADAVRFSVHPELDGQDRHQLKAVVIEELELFRKTAPPPTRSGLSLVSRIVVLPNLRASYWAALDQVYDDLKNTAVQHGLMIGQFHPACDEPAIRNLAFPVSRAPVALLAIRRMAPHDILFLHTRPEWFAAYQQRFGDHIHRRELRDPHLRRLYGAAAKRHSVRTLTTQRRRAFPHALTGSAAGRHGRPGCGSDAMPPGMG